MLVLASLLVPLIPTIIQGVETLIGRGEGAAKKEAAVGIASAVVRFLRESGTLDGKSLGGIDALQIADAVQAIFNQMKADGRLVEAGKPPPGEVPGGCLLRQLMP